MRYAEASPTSGWKPGWTIGGGVEWQIAPHWSLKAEYLYASLSSITTTIPYAYAATSALCPPAFRTGSISRASV
jgi:outer membrane immunogenic protein